MSMLLSATREHPVELGKSDLLPQDDEAAIGQLTAVGFDVAISARRRLEFEAASFATRPFCKSIANIDSVTKTTGMAREATVRLMLRAKDPSVKAPPCPVCKENSWTTVVPGFTDGMTTAFRQTAPHVEARCAM